jgi:hypothetical protein
MNEVQVFRPKGNWVWGICTLTLDALFSAQFLFYPVADENPIGNIVVALFIAIAAVSLWLRPKLVLRKDDLVVVNPFDSVTIRYTEIDSLETKWSLLIVHGTKKTRVWVAPVNGKHRWVADNANQWFFMGMPRSAEKHNQVTSISNSPESDSGVAAQIIQRRIDELH